MGLHLPSFGEWIIIAAIGLLFFGKRLPEVGRSMAKSIVEFKKGLKEVENDVEDAVVRKDPPASTSDVQPRFDPYTGKPLPAPEQKFDPYTGKPLAETEPVGQGSSVAH